MRFYEVLYILHPDLSDEEYAALVQRFNDVVEKHNGVVIKVEEWGKKTLAYPVKRAEKGSYVLLQYCGEPGLKEELERLMRIEANVLKYLTVKLSDEADAEALKAQALQSAPNAPEEPEAEESEQEDQEQVSEVSHE